MTGKPIRLGTVQTINVQTGEVVSEKQGAFTLPPPRPGVCPECATDHPPNLPHNLDSLYYQMAFAAQHGRAPTWTDAMAHCTPKVRELWTKSLVEELPLRGKEIPADLRQAGDKTGSGGDLP